MECVQTLKEIKSNILIIDHYLDKKHDPEYSFAVDLIKRGTCFIAVKTDSGYRFYPSRFTGYVGNTMDKHLNNEYKDGKETTPAITKVINQRNVPNPILDHDYKLYCEKLGFFAREKGAFGVTRKFWELVD